METLRDQQEMDGFRKNRLKLFFPLMLPSVYCIAIYIRPDYPSTALKEKFDSQI